MCSFLQQLQLANRRSAIHHTAIFHTANRGCSCICRKLEAQGCTEGFTRDARSYEKIWYCDICFWFRFSFSVVHIRARIPVYLLVWSKWQGKRVENSVMGGIGDYKCTLTNVIFVKEIRIFIAKTEVWGTLDRNMHPSLFLAS